MTREDIGWGRSTLHVPDGGGPGVIMFPDAGGVREVMREMADGLAALGYVVLLPDIYYRAGDWAPFDVATLFDDPSERARLGTLAGPLTPELLADDAGAWASFLLTRSSGDVISTTGYCMGGQMSLLAACSLGPQVAAAASFHGGRLAVADDPESPHQFVAGIRGRVYVAAAENDRSFPPEQAQLLGTALSSAGVEHTIETYAAGHGFAVPDNPTFDAEAATRHWSALENLFGSTL